MGGGGSGVPGHPPRAGVSTWVGSPWKPSHGSFLHRGVIGALTASSCLSLCQGWGEQGGHGLMLLGCGTHWDVAPSGCGTQLLDAECGVPAPETAPSPPTPHPKSEFLGTAISLTGVDSELGAPRDTNKGFVEMEKGFPTGFVPTATCPNNVLIPLSACTPWPTTASCWSPSAAMPGIRTGPVSIRAPNPYGQPKAPTAQCWGWASHPCQDQRSPLQRCPLHGAGPAMGLSPGQWVLSCRWVLGSA